jgi:hypothetical protein
MQSFMFNLSWTLEASFPALLQYENYLSLCLLVDWRRLNAIFYVQSELELFFRSGFSFL